MRLTLRLLLAIAIALGLCIPAHAGGKVKRPNIVYIMSDDHASAAISCYGSWLSKQFKTPNLDRLASQGMRFTNALVTNSICTPSRAAILTGQYSHKNGVFTLDDPIDPSRIHIGHLFQRAGYATALIGKWHLHTDPAGFDFWEILPGQGRYLDPIFITQKKEKKLYKGKYATDVTTDLSIEWLKSRDKSKPFVLMCHHKAPHRPWDPAPREKDLFEGVTIAEPPTLLDHWENRSKAAANTTMVVGPHNNAVDLGEPIPKDLKGDELRRWAYQKYMKRYLACVKTVDDNIGRLLDFLTQEGLDDNTIVIYTSDQGFFLGEHGYYDKRLMYEPCLNTPLIVRYPGHIKSGTVNEKMVLNIDFGATMLDYAGIAIPKNMQGRSFRALLEGKSPDDWRTSMYYRYYMHLAQHSVPAHYGVRTERYTLIYFYGQPLGMSGALNKPTEPEWELFDRQKDPEQMRNVYRDPAYAGAVTMLKAELDRLRQEVGDDDSARPKALKKKL
jgi:arylsulfatase A-like enzyme